MTETTEFILGLDGIVSRRTVSQVQLLVPPNALDGLYANLKLVAPAVCDLPRLLTPHTQDVNKFVSGPMSLVLSQRLQLAFVRLSAVPMTTTFRPAGNKDAKIMLPTFERETPENPALRVLWNLKQATGDGALVYYAQDIAWDASRSCYYSRKEWLLARETGAARYYRLPLGNLYEDAALCCGSYTSRSPNLADTLILGLKQLAAAPWNADLVSLHKQTDSETLFQFTPDAEGNQFVTLPQGGKKSWHSYCQKISTPITELIG